MTSKVLAIAIGTMAAASFAAAQPPPGGVGLGPGERGGFAGQIAGVREALPGGGEVAVQGAPFSADGVTTTTQTLVDGTRIERTVTAKMYRDTDGRLRREQTIVGLAALTSTGEAQIITIVDPVARVTYSLNPANHTGLRMPRPAGVARRRVGGAPPPPPPPPAGGDVNAATAPPPPPPPPPPGARGRGAPRAGTPNLPEPLGTRQIDGLTVAGTKRTEVIAAGLIGNDRPIEITDERWESTELKVLVLSHHHDPRTGDVEYRLTNVNRAEPPRELFLAPADYTITDAPPPPPPAPRRPE